MRVLVTGAGGFLGSHVTRALVERGCEVTAVVRSHDWRLAGVMARTVRADLDSSCESLLAEARPAVVCDLAWHGVGNRFHHDSTQVEMNLRTHLDLVRAAGHAGCRRFVGLGSQAEYGPHPGRLDETATTVPVTLYGATKLAVGAIGRQLAIAAGMEFVWLRLFSTYGPMDDPAWLIPSVILSLLRGGRPDLTPGTQKWDYLFVGDAAGAIAEACCASVLDGTFNLGSGRPVAVREIVEAVRDLVDPRLSLAFGARPFGPNQLMHLEADISKLSAAISWRPTTSLSDGLSRTVDWYRGNLDRYPA
jgi:nucleoside-diphosphate-sugar epimerase